MSTKNVDHQPPKPTKNIKLNYKSLDDKYLPDMSIREWFHAMKMVKSSIELS